MQLATVADHYWCGRQSEVSGIQATEFIADRVLPQEGTAGNLPSLTAQLKVSQPRSPPYSHSPPAAARHMDHQLFVICALTFVIHLIGTLAYAVRIAGVRTGRIAVSFALFNILVLVSRTSNSFQGPFLAKRIERSINLDLAQGVLTDFRWILASATLATLIGALLIPSFQRLFSRAVLHFQVHRSVAALLMHGFFKGGLSQLKDVASVPAAANVTQMGKGHGISATMLAMNVVAIALWTIGVFASLYAGYLNPEFRVTSSTLSSVINGVATIMMFMFIDPHMSVMTDDVVDGRTSQSQFRRAVVWLVATRFIGTLLGQILLVPAAMLIVILAKAM
jgi:hypothetical protein